jgi:hypothetical protein
VLTAVKPQLRLGILFVVQFFQHSFIAHDV